jgi:hypothetical protein
MIKTVIQYLPYLAAIALLVAVATAAPSLRSYADQGRLQQEADQSCLAPSQAMLALVYGDGSACRDPASNPIPPQG